ncbi:hypothetical protein CDV36_004928 [Fusarium kuroshium]|uniref:F-box domain-containing protein n=1 Tax=Fusarium kuroshium TaxID=2010991 RepID=A0A3M2SCV9_9HYPO|nr:hypothetical protein CDV36_004928 [Fusarium kuroshium]
MSLTDFSSEILLQICEELCPHCQEKHMEIPRPDWWRRDSSRRGLLSLLLVNKKIGAIAQRVLYHHFGYVEKDQNPDDLVRFCLTICAKPELGKCLRWANLSCSRVEVNYDMTQEYFDRGNPRSALATLILLQAPNLERLDDDVLEEFAHFYVGLRARHRQDAATVSDICQVLAQRKDTLRRLLLDASCTTDNIDHLRELDNLEELKICAGPILERQRGTDRLQPYALASIMPPSLKKLHVKSKMPGLDRAGEALITYIQSTYRESPDEQKLKHVYFDVYEEPDRTYFPFRGKLERTCRDWIKNGTVVFKVGRFAWDDMGDWGSGEGNIDAEDNRI